MEKKYVCKHCFKRFPCGKSLGGHIRTHSEERTSSAVAVAVAHNNNDAAFNFNLKLDGAAGRRKKRDLWSDSDANSIYGLRENPKKTMRFVHSDSNPPAVAAATLEQQEVEEKFCKECGKGFPSLKALCGHMACHSDKDKKINNNSKVVVMDNNNNNNTSSQSDTTETCVPRRSKRFKSLTLSNHKKINEVEQEVQDGAMCLILLSKDPNFNYMDHFVLDSKSSSFDTNKIEFRNGTTSNFGGQKKLIKDIKLKSVEFGGFEDYRSKYNNVNAFNKFTMKDDSVGDNLVDKRENDWKYERLVSESYDDDDDDSADYESDEKSSESDSYDSKAVMMNGKKKKNSKVEKKKKKLKLKSKKSSKEHECPICYRIFKSGQALGGHKRSHFVGGNEENTLVIKQAAVPCLIDLNLPAPVDE